MVLQKGRVKDWQITATLSLVVAFYFLLSQYNNAQTVQVVYAYIAMSFGATIGIMGLITVLGQPRANTWVVDWDENLSFQGVAVAVGGMVAIYLVSFYFLSLQQILYVPIVSISSFSVVPAPLSQALWQIFIVAYSEEFFKLNVISSLGNRVGEFWGVGFGVGVWAVFHAFLAFSNIAYILPTFSAGIAIYIVLRYTKSILAAILAHGVYNWTVAVFVSNLGNQPAATHIIVSTLPHLTVGLVPILTLLIAPIIVVAALITR